MRPGSRLVRALSVTVAVVLLLWFFGNLMAVVVGLGGSRVLAGEVSGMLDRIVPSAIRAQDELAASAGRDPEHRWIEQDCSFTTDDSGWIAYSYRETCVMRSVSAWRVDSAREARALLPVRDGHVSLDGGCLPLGVVGKVGVVEGPDATYVDTDDPDADPWCTAASDDAEGSRELVGDLTTIDSGRWLVVVAEQPLVDVPIGCARWSVVFCDNPWLVHAYGDWP